MDKIKIACSVAASAPGLTLSVKIDDQVLWQADPAGCQDIAIELADEDDAAHTLTFELSGKMPQHTKLDQDGNVIEDLVVHVQDITFDQLDMQQRIYDHAVYSHDFNGNGPKTQDRFYGTMGCNGTVSLRFTTPLYLWLLENM